MRNLKLKQVLPVQKAETLQKVKETPGLHVMGDLFDCSCDDRLFVDSKLLTEHCLKLV